MGHLLKKNKKFNIYVYCKQFRIWVIIFCFVVIFVNRPYLLIIYFVFLWYKYLYNILFKCKNNKSPYSVELPKLELINVNIGKTPQLDHIGM